MGQISNIPGVEIHRPDVKFPPLRIRANDGSSLSLPEVQQRLFPDFPPYRNGWRVFCPRLLGRSILKFIIGAPMDKNGKLIPTTVKMNGSYELMPSHGSKAVKVDVNTKVIR